MKIASRIVAIAALAIIPLSALAETTVSGTSVTTTGPVTSATTIDTGTMAGQALMWVASVFGTTIGGVITMWLWKLFSLAGLQVSETLRAKLQEIIVNGLNAGAKVEADHLQGKGVIEVKNDIVARAVTYTQAHGAETLKALGLDPTSDRAVEAIKARIETAIADPSAPTPAVLAPAIPAVVK